jgi:alkanesulfonate monooxygenase SsuD/methylene tetrahydromethanopterin reductase-like flavin-dependent oxidoreductase (luciferase family)
MLGTAGIAYRDSWESLQDKGIIMVGSPDTMIKKITLLYERTGIGHLMMMNQAGPMGGAKVRRSLELFAREVYPAIRHLGGGAAAPPPALVA